jgi:hypothetical protein
MNNELTNYPNGVASFGIPALPYSNMIHVGSTVVDGETNVVGDTHRWVNGNTGSDGNDGLSPSTPMKTMAACFLKLNSGDIIHFNGNITEQLTTPAGIFDVTIIGEGNLPRNADAHTTSNGYSSATWKYPSSPTAATPLLKIQQQGWRLVNILFSGSLANTPDVVLFRDGGAGDSERDASHASIIGCRFDGGVIALQDSGGCAFVQVLGCSFRGFTTCAMQAITGAGIGTLLAWNIEGNRFMDNVIHLDMGLTQGTIKSNTFGKFTTTSIDLTGGANNTLYLNALAGTYSIVGGYTPGTNDEWGGNFNSLTGGVTAADPA